MNCMSASKRAGNFTRISAAQVNGFKYVQDFTSDLVSIRRAGRNGYMVRNAHRAYDRVLATALSKQKVLTGQWSLLRVLWHEDNLSQIEVANRMKIERASLTIMLNTVEKAGLITRKIDARDRRKQLISLTRKGRAFQSCSCRSGQA